MPPTGDLSSSPRLSSTLLCPDSILWVEKSKDYVFTASQDKLQVRSLACLQREEKCTLTRGSSFERAYLDASSLCVYAAVANRSDDEAKSADILVWKPSMKEKKKSSLKYGVEISMSDLSPPLEQIQKIPIKQWGPVEVVDLLAAIGFGPDARKMFFDEKIDGSQLIWATRETLTKLGVASKEEQTKLLEAIAATKRIIRAQHQKEGVVTSASSSNLASSSKRINMKASSYRGVMCNSSAPPSPEKPNSNGSSSMRRNSMPPLRSGRIVDTRSAKSDSPERVPSKMSVTVTCAVANAVKVVALRVPQNHRLSFSGFERLVSKTLVQQQIMEQECTLQLFRLELNPDDTVTKREIKNQADVEAFLSCGEHSPRQLLVEFKNAASSKAGGRTVSQRRSSVQNEDRLDIDDVIRINSQKQKRKSQGANGKAQVGKLNSWREPE